MKKKNMLELLDEGLFKVEGAFLVIMMWSMLALCLAQIAFRLLNNPIPWSESALTYMFVWSALIAASYAIGKNAHFKMDMLTEHLKGNVKKGVYIVVCLCVIGSCLFLLYYGIDAAILAKRQMMFDMPFTMFPPKLSVPVGFGFATIHAVSNLVNVIKDKETDKMEVSE